MTFHQLRTGEFFCFSGMTTTKVYRKVNACYCSQNGFLQPIRPHTRIRRLSSLEVQAYLESRIPGK
jgi:hypothetical protein